jgi:hypothetical protein
METQNIAFNKAVNMSTVHVPAYHGGKYAVDGKVVLEGTGLRCTHTLGEINPWIVVDLGAIYNTRYVTLFNRIDAHGKTYMYHARRFYKYL